MQHTAHTLVQAPTLPAALTASLRHRPPGSMNNDQVMIVGPAETERRRTKFDTAVPPLRHQIPGPKELLLELHF
jgi:hypothetical protein